MCGNSHGLTPFQFPLCLNPICDVLLILHPDAWCDQLPLRIFSGRDQIQWQAPSWANGRRVVFERSERRDEGSKEDRQREHANSSEGTNKNEANLKVGM